MTGRRCIERVFVAALLLAACGLLSARGSRAQDAQPEPIPVEGRTYTNAIRFEGRDWPLPQGDWELLSYVPRSSPFGSGRSFRVVLARFDQTRQPIAILLYAVGEVGDALGSSVGDVGSCQQPPVAFQAERQIVDEKSEFTCWKIYFADAHQLPNDPIYDALRLKLRLPERGPTKFTGIGIAKKQGGRVGHADIWFNPAYLQTRKLASGRPITAEEMTPGTRGPFEGTRLAILELLRAWAIRWQEPFAQGFAGGLKVDPQATIPLPMLQNPQGTIPMAPDMGIKDGSTYENVVPIGPFMLPLPKGIWTARLRKPRVNVDGTVAIDQVTLVKIENGRLDGTIALETRLEATKTVQVVGGPPCELDSAKLAYREGPDQYCAALNWYRIYRDDARFPLFQELDRDGVKLPNSLIGSVFSFSNKVIRLRALVAFSPDHVGLPDVTSDNTGTVPPEWVPFAAKWQQWTRDWGVVFDAGFSGRLGLGPLPVVWRDLDLKAETLARASQPELGKTYVGTVPLGGRNWPLPPGEWTLGAIAPLTQGAGNEIVSDQVYLARLVSGRITGVVDLVVLRPDIPPPLNTPMQACTHEPSYFNRRVQFDLGVRQDCSLIRLEQNAEARAVRKGFGAFEAEMRARGMVMPQLMWVTSFNIMDRNRGAFVAYGFPAVRLVPEIRAREANDVANWRLQNSALGVYRDAAYRALRDWSDAWHEVFKLGFDGKLDAGPLPAAWRDLDLETLTVARAVQPELGRVYAGTVPIGGRHWPLPPGKWMLGAIVPDMVGAEIAADRVYLANVVDGRVWGIIILVVLRPAFSTTVDTPALSCKKDPDYFHRRLQFDLGVRQDCWAIHLQEKTQLASAMKGFDVFEAEMRTRGFALPPLMLLALFDIVDQSLGVFGTYGFATSRLAPEVQAPQVNDVATWLRQKGPLDVHRESAFRALHDWTEAWHGVFQLGFDGKLGPSPLPQPWRDREGPWPRVANQ